MTNAEHLIENAIEICLKDGTFDDFKAIPWQQEYIDLYGITLQDIWAMAVHVVYTYKPEWEGKFE